MIKYDGQKLTPNQAAKAVIIDRLKQCAEYGLEFLVDDPCYDKDSPMTEREEQAVIEQLYKRVDGLLKYLGHDWQ